MRPSCGRRFCATAGRSARRASSNARPCRPCRHMAGMRACIRVGRRRRCRAAATVWIVSGSLGLGSSVFEAMAMLAPSAAARSAMARPIPRLAPVMNRVLPLSDRIMTPRLIAGVAWGPLWFSPVKAARAAITSGFSRRRSAGSGPRTARCGAPCRRRDAGGRTPQAQPR
jgi:hypothetical protein